MFGKPLKPSECSFTVALDNDDIICLYIEDNTDSDNDDVREVEHPDFDSKWSNACENVFESEEFTTINEARKWCQSIGMLESKKDLSDIVGG